MSEPQPPRLQRMLSPDTAHDGDGDERAAMATRTSLTTSASRREKTCGIGGA